MAKIIIGELDIDLNALIKSTAEVKSAIDTIKSQQAELVKQGKASSNQFVQNAADLKTLGTAYTSNLKAISESTQAQVENANRTQLVAMALQSEATSIKEARDQNVLLNKLRNETNLTTKEGKAELEQLNAKLDENNAFIKDNADQYLKQKINIGNYSESIKDALTNLNPLNGGLSGFIERSNAAGGAGNLLKEGLGAATQGIVGMTRASLTFLATPIGAILGVIGLALGAVVNYLKSTKSGMDALTAVTRPLEAVMTALGTVVNMVGKALVGAFSNPKKALSDLYDFVKQNLINRFTAFKVILEGIMELDFKKVTNGVLQAGTGVENMTDKIQAGAKATGKFLDDAIEKGKQIDKLKKQIEESELSYQRAQIKTQDAIDQQLLITKDTSKSFKERGAAAEEIIRLTEALSKKEEEIIQKKIKALQLEYSLKDAKDLTIEEQQKLIDLEKQLDEAQDRGINARLENSRVISGLKKEEQAQAEDAAKKQAELNQKILDDAVKVNQARLALYISEQGNRAKNLTETLTYAETIYQKQLEINKREYEASQKTEVDKLALQTANNNARNELLKAQTDAVIANADHELEIYKELNKSKLEANKFYTDEAVAQELERLNRIAEEEANAQTLRLQNGIITEQQYRDAIKAIDDEYDANKKVVEEIKAQEDADKKAIDLDNQRLEANATFDEQFTRQEEQLNRQREAELKAANKNGADKKIINAKYDKAILDAKIATQDAELSLTAQTLGQLKGFLKENTVVAKALGVAEATINTYLGATKALATLPPPFGAIMAGVTVATGLGQVAKIAGVQFAGGGFVEANGPSHAEGGIPIHIGGQYFGEMQGGEGLAIMNKGAFSAFKNFNSTYGDADVKSNYAPTFMAGGGIISQGVQAPGIDVVELANITAQAIKLVPPPIVAVEDIRRGSASYTNVVEGANH